MDHESTRRRPISDDLNVTDLIKGLARSVKDVWRHWKGIIIGILLCGILSAIWYHRQRPVYPARLSFILSDDNAGQMSSVTAAIAQFGLPVTSGRYNVDKLLEIAKTRRIIQDAIFNKITIRGDEDFLANHLIHKHQLSELWEKNNSDLASFKFSHADVSTFSAQENHALKKLYQTIIGSREQEGLFITDYGKTDYLMYLIFKGLDPELSVHFVNHLYDALAAFYRDNLSHRHTESYVILKEKRDSLSNALSAVNTSLVRSVDRNFQALDLESGGYTQKLRTDQIILQSALAKAEELLGVAEIALKSQSQLIQLLDRPILPIREERPSKLRLCLFSMVGGVLLYGLYVFIILVRKS